MQLTFLEASVPLTKSYEKRADGSIVGGAYPGVTNFTSHCEEVESIEEFATALKEHAELGHCLLTNSLTRPVENESRAGLSNKNERRPWILLDIDGLDHVSTVEQFINTVLPAPFHTASYVVQYSPSQGIKPGVRAHIYFMLYDLVDTRVVEAWLAETNLTNSLLSNQVTLSKSNLALSYPLDRVASRNGRIIYITRPECVGFDDPVEERIIAVVKDHDKVSFAFSAMTPAEVAGAVRDKVNELRKAKNLPVSKKANHIKRVDADGRELLLDELVERGTITGWIEDNDRFMRVNINGGDSWAYYFHRDQQNPYIHNFKGEPSIRLSVFDPQFYDDHVVPHFEELQKLRPRPFVFRDRHTDKYFVGLRQDHAITEQPMPIGGRDKIEDYFLQHAGVSLPHHIETWSREFDPTRDGQWHPGDKVFNTWRPSEFQEYTLGGSSVPTVIDKILRHVTGDEESYHAFINWLACIQQTREKPGTAWVLHGVPGTGKGLLFSYILTPIFGADYCVIKQIKDLKDKFNGWMEQTLLCNIDEANADDLSYESKEIINALKNWITEPRISVRHMQAQSYNAPSYINFIFTTNDFGILPIQEGDRRINVARRQETKLEISAEEVASIESELASFSAFLSNYDADFAAARRTLENTSKDAAREAARSSIDSFFAAVREGDLQYFMEGIHEDSKEYGEVAIFKEAVEQWMDDAKNGHASQITVPQLRAAHVVMCRDRGMKSGAFKSMAAKHGLPGAKRREGGDRWTGWKGEWNMTQELKRELKCHLQPVDLEAKVEAEVKASQKAKAPLD